MRRYFLAQGKDDQHAITFLNRGGDGELRPCLIITLVSELSLSGFSLAIALPQLIGPARKWVKSLNL
jgi:hypothetical protein